MKVKATWKVLTCPATRKFAALCFTRVGTTVSYFVLIEISQFIFCHYKEYSKYLIINISGIRKAIEGWPQNRQYKAGSNNRKTFCGQRQLHQMAFHALTVGYFSHIIAEKSLC